MAQNKEIWVYLDCDLCDGNPLLMGVLTCESVRGREVFSFSCNDQWLQHPDFRLLDPDLGQFSGPQYLRDEKANFGLFLDSSPDRWGRLLIKRREAITARMENRSRRTLMESDYLLGVFDKNRMGGLRFKLSPDGEFLDNDGSLSIPPWASLRELEYACARYEEGIFKSDSEEAKWIRMIFAPGSSLGGARPKANVCDTNGSLWIAKFPSRNDERDMAAWEMLAYTLAIRCGVHMSDSRIGRFVSRCHTFLTKRFDRTPEGVRRHFASAMTMLGRTDGTDSVDGASYLDLAEFIITNGTDVDENLHQLWLRMVFNIAISNCDDHLRNHGFLLTGKGWVLSPAYDINPDPDGQGLKLNIDESDNSLDFQLAMEAAPYFRLKKAEATGLLDHVKSAVATWPSVATKLGISRQEQDDMASAFHL